MKKLLKKIKLILTGGFFKKHSEHVDVQSSNKLFIGIIINDEPIIGISLYLIITWFEICFYFGKHRYEMNIKIREDAE